MTSSGCVPQRLLDYPGALTGANENLRRFAGRVEDALQAVDERGGDFVPGLNAESLGDWIRDIAGESEHLERFVRGVGQAFIDAGGGGDDLSTLDDNTISKQVGEPTRREAEEAANGQAAAREVRDALEDLGIDPDEFNPAMLATLDPRDPDYQELFSLLTDVGDEMRHEDYAVGFYDVLGPDGIRAVIGVTETFATHGHVAPQDYGDTSSEFQGEEFPELPWDTVNDEILTPLVDGWAKASGSVDLTEERDEILSPDTVWEQHQLAVLSSARGYLYDPDFLAESADVILYRQPELNQSHLGTDSIAMQHFWDQTYPPLGVGPDLLGPEFSFDELPVMRALSENEEASYRYVNLGGDGDERLGRLETILRPDTFQIEDSWSRTGSEISYDQAKELAELKEELGAVIAENIIIDTPVSDPDRYQESLDIYADVVRVVGDGDIPDVTKRVTASALPLYIDDIGDVAYEASDTLELTDEQKAESDFNRPDLVDFFQELGYDDEAAELIGIAFGGWSVQESAPLLGDTDLTESELQRTLIPFTLLLGAAESGFEETGGDLEERQNFFLRGLEAGANVLISGGSAAIPATGGWSVLLAGGGVGLRFLVGEAIDNVDSAEAPVSGGDLESRIVENLRRNMARLIAEDMIERGELGPGDRPGDGEYREFLLHLEQFENVGDPTLFIDDLTSDHVADAPDGDEHWATSTSSDD